MAHGQYHTVSFRNNQYPSIQMYEDQNYDGHTYNGNLPIFGNGWAVIWANPQKYLVWVRGASFSNINPDGTAGPGFIADAGKLNRLNSLTSGIRGRLEITLVREVSKGIYTFTNGRHRAYWLAENSATLVPLLVPVHQVSHFQRFL